MVKDIHEMNQQMILLMEKTVSDNKKISFSDECKSIVKEMADFARTTHFYQDNVKNLKKFWQEWSNVGADVKDPAFVLSFIMVKIASAPNFMAAMCSVIGHMPYLDELLNGEA